MKVLCIADHVDPLVYSGSIKPRFGHVDAVLAAGDLPMEYLGFVSASLNRPIFFVFGNHHLQHLSRFRRWGLQSDDERYDLRKDEAYRNYFGSTYIGGRVVRFRGLLIGGLGGCRRYNRGENQFTESQMLFRIVTMVPRLLWNRVVHGRYLDILLAHSPPFGINDLPDLTHTGFRVFLRFIRWFRPRYLLHGHVHLYDLNANRAADYNGTAIINVYDHYVLELAPDERQHDIRSH